jgi:outer membrane protein
VKRLALIVMVLAMRAAAESLTLEQAESIAKKNHPALRAGALESLAAGERVKQARAARMPVIGGSFTAVGADNETRMAAGGLNNPVLYSRLATGFAGSQTLLDFGRANKLIDSAAASADARAMRVERIREDVILAVRRAYFNALRAESVLRVARATVETRALAVDQIAALVKAQLKSSLDLSFAETTLAEARLLVSTAENDRRAAYAELGQALGRQSGDPIDLADMPDPAIEPLALSELHALAANRRADLRVARLDLQAARSFAEAERALRFPTVSAVVSAGYVPSGGPRLSTEYAAAGVNIAMPFLNGGAFKARHAEASFRAEAVNQGIRELENRVAREVSTAWLNVNTAVERIALTRRYVEQATQALELAQTRYDLGLSSIVELGQAQLAKTNAEIQSATAKYEYHMSRTLLDYQTGSL